MANDRSSSLVGIPEIAKMLDPEVKPSAVSNWRRRHDDFPAPKVNSRSGLLFDFDEVEDWLLLTGKIEERLSASHRFFPYLEALSRSITPGEAAELTRAVLVFWIVLKQNGTAREQLEKLEDDAGIDQREAVSAECSDLVHAQPELHGLFEPLQAGPSGLSPQSFAELVQLTGKVVLDTEDLGDLFDSLVSQLRERDRNLSAVITSPNLVRLVSALIEPGARSILDPALGSGELLLESARSSGASEIAGFDVNLQTLALARSRFLAHGRKLDAEASSSLEVSGALARKADLLVADPPMALKDWGSAETYRSPQWRFGEVSPARADFAWLQAASLVTNANGRGYVYSSTGSLFRGGFERRIRQNMLDAGVVEAVILLPAKLRTDSTIPMVLWILRSAESPSPGASVLLLDASDMAKQGRSVSHLPDESIATIAEIVSEWRRTQVVSEIHSGIAIGVAPEDIQKTNLTPTRYLSSARLDLDELAKEHAELVQKAKSLSPPRVPSESDLSLDLQSLTVGQNTTLKEVAQIWEGRILPRSELEPSPSSDLVHLMGLRELGGESPRRIARETAENRNLIELQPDDLIFGPHGDGVRTDIVSRDKVGWYLGPGAYLIRVREPERVEVGWIELLLLSGSWVRQAEVGTTVKRYSRKELCSLTLNLPALQIQRQISSQVTRVSTAEQEMSEAAALLRQLKRATASLVIGKTLESTQ